MFVFNYLSRLTVVFFLMLSVGKYLGFEGIKPVLIDKQMFHSLCHYKNHSIPYPKYQTCDAQLLRIDSIFQISLSMCVAYLLVGGLVDFFYSRFKVHFVYYPLFVLSGICCVTFGVSVTYRQLDDYYFLAILSFSFMSVCDFGLWFVFLKVMMDVPEKYSKFASLANGLTNAAFNLSILFFYLVSAIYFYVAKRFLLILCIYSGIMLVLFFFYGFILEIPQRCLPPEEDVSEKEPILGTKDAKKTEIVIERPPSPPPVSVAGTKRERFKSLFSSLFSVQYICLIIWFSIAMTQLNFYVSTVFDQVLFLGNSAATAKQYSDIFSIVWPVTAFIFSIIFGFLVIYFKVSIVVMCILNVLWSVLSVIPVLQIHFPLFFFESVSNCLTYIVQYESIVWFFGMEFFTTLSSLGYCIGGVVSLSTMLMNFASVNWLRSYVITNGISGVMGVAAHVMFLICVLFSKRGRKKKVAQKAINEKKTMNMSVN